MSRSGKTDPVLRGFYKKTRGERLDALKAACSVPIDQLRVLSQDASLSFDLANLFIENALGSHPLPLGVVTNLQINDKNYVVPFAVEESSVIAAASNASKWVMESGGFHAECLGREMIGQIQILDLDPNEFENAAAKIKLATVDLIDFANLVHPRLRMRGGGTRSIEIRSFPKAEIPFMVVHVHLDPKEAMGANLVNTVCEKLAPKIQEIVGGRIGLRILSNLADRRLFRVRCEVDFKQLEINDAEFQLSGLEVAKRIHEAYVFAKNDSYRATTHNKGIMNGIDPVVIATGNDWRAVEAGAHAFAARNGHYESLSKWTVDTANEVLKGELLLPLQLGTVGGITRLHPTSKAALQILGNPSSEELSMICLSCGLASNLAALRALVTTGIQRGHMKLHAKNLALAAGAKPDEVEQVAMELVINQNVSASAAESLIQSLREKSKTRVDAPNNSHEL
jgi:hydroxymethylglutaryl-CoA reductase